MLEWSDVQLPFNCQTSSQLMFHTDTARLLPMLTITDLIPASIWWLSSKQNNKLDKNKKVKVVYQLRSLLLLATLSIYCSTKVLCNLSFCLFVYI